MIIYAQANSIKDLSKMHAILEHTQHDINNTFIAHYFIAGNPAQDIYIDRSWHEIMPFIGELFGNIDGPMEIIMVNATILEVF